MLPVLITGAPGSGRARIARVIHEQSHLCDQLFVPVDRTASADDAFEKLLGDDGIGLQDAPQFPAGTVLLTLGDLGDHAQAALSGLLEALLGRWRVITAGPHDLAARVGAGQFSDRLFYRMNAIHLVMPASVEADLLDGSTVSDTDEIASPQQGSTLIA